MKLALLAAPALFTCLASLSECFTKPPAPTASFTEAGSAIDLRAPREETPPPPSAHRESPPPPLPPLDFTEQGARPWQKPRATIERERNEVLDRTPGE